MAEVTVGGLRFHVQRLGPEVGVPVVFLHGLIMDNLSSWFFTAAPKVAAHQPVLLYDLRGHGKSERPTAGYSVEDMVGDLGGILDESLPPAQSVELVGNSFGGLLALAFALARPERVRGLCLVDGQVHDEAFGPEMVSSLGLEGRERDEMIARSFKAWLGRHSERKRNRLARNASELVHGTSLVQDLAHSAPPSTQELERVSCPVLALYGEHSDVRERGENLAARLPNAQLEIVEGCTHSLLWEQTAQLEQRVLSWVGRESGPGGKD
jgi:pimeloyl-ACP methyl ester carboxylesterase